MTQHESFAGLSIETGVQNCTPHFKVPTFLTRIPHLNSCSLFFADNVSIPNLVLKVNVSYINRIKYP